jgi:hypothetical protein
MPNDVNLEKCDASKVAMKYCSSFPNNEYFIFSFPFKGRVYATV